MTAKNKPNGSYATKHGPNGGAVVADSATDGAANEASHLSSHRISARATQHEQSRAESVDASVFSVADSASPAVSTDRDATADLAEPAAGKRLPGTETASMPARPPVETDERQPLAAPARKSGRKSPGRSASRAVEPANPFAQIPAGRAPLPIDGEAFVDAVHTQVDLVALEVALLRSTDEKIVQRELACLRELRYGKVAPEVSDDPTQIIWNAPRPERDQS